MSTQRPSAASKATPSADSLRAYANRFSPEHAAVCESLRAVLDTALPQATSKIWHGAPVWFIGENPVVGYNVTAKKGVSLLFWSGQSFGEPELKAVGKFKAAQMLYSNVAEIDSASLRRWLKKAAENIWDYRSHFTNQKALQRSAAE